MTHQLEVRLTEAGREQARALGRAAGPVDLVVHTAFSRTRETAELAWPGVPLAELPDLNEFAFGHFEGTQWTDGFHDWVLASAPDEGAPGGGESRVAAVTRFARGYRTLLGRPEERIAVVAHGAPVRYVLLGARPQAARPACWRGSTRRGRSVIDAAQLRRRSKSSSVGSRRPVGRAD